MYFSVFLVFVYAVGHREHFWMTGANQAIFAHEGEDVILNCSVDSHVPVSEIEEVTWKKTDGEEDILVLLYQNSEIFPDSSHESYQGRVDFFSSEISKGNFSLQLKDVKMEDKGEFTCEVHTSNMSARTTVVLHGVEHFVVKGADHAVFAHKGEDVILNCSVDSHVPKFMPPNVSHSLCFFILVALNLLGPDLQSTFLNSKHQ
ncbi:hypothetical protein C0J45_2050 [Silurus meridionalis]|nr:hypothetical protein C0J45_2050 [Silurus meridionalis]